MERLAAVIIEEIKEQGPITFKQFMERALYYPQLGYYNTAAAKIGKDGDFYTSSDVSSLFGEMLADQFAEMWHKLDKPNDFYLIECGAGKGVLARDILKRLKVYEELAEKLTYIIVEISPEMQEHQRKNLKSLMDSGISVSWSKSVAHIPDLIGGKKVTGCVFSNELLDAFPVHIVKQGETLKEVGISTNELGEFVEILMEPTTPALEQHLIKSEIKLEHEQIIEINLQALEWLSDVANIMEYGYIVTIDYGYLAKELAAPHRHQGTLICYENHQAIDNPYENVGNRDITAHVNFSALISWGEELELKTLGYTNQGKFLLAMGIMEQLGQKSLFECSPSEIKRVQNAKKLVMPGGMGEMFKVLIQGKGINGDALRLRGLSPF
ncbi:SAM-dependent MidA family methyltransferase [Desulfitispora alkaliphila]|uniref:class I SAM-dependent methyltransferase n=1 Tax=Desulfitispora alkaliphila TaxID=622674 RepID=UPI003D1BB9BA